MAASPHDPEFKQFDSTHWSLVGRAMQDRSSVRRVALNELLRQYMPALRAFLVRGRGMNANDADDVLNEFVTERILEGSFLGHVDRSKGRFRSLLVSSLVKFQIDRVRRTQAAKRAPDRAASIEDEWLEKNAVTNENSSLFDVAWAREVLLNVLRRMQTECLEPKRAKRASEADGTAIWGVFVARELKPVVLNTQPESYDELIDKLGFKSPTQASNALITAKRMFRRQLEAVLAEYCTSDGEITVEIDQLYGALQSAGPLDEDLAEFLGAQQSASFPEGDPMVSMCGSIASIKLASMYEINDAQPLVWSPEELTSMLKHLLKQPWTSATTEAAEKPDTATHRRSRTPSREEAIPTLEAVLTSPRGFLSELKAIKRWGKEVDSVLPTALKNVVYYAVLATAYSRADTRLTKLADDQFEEGLEWVLRQKWISTFVRQLISEAMLRVRGDSR